MKQTLYRITLLLLLIPVLSSCTPQQFSPEEPSSAWAADSTWYSSRQAVSQDKTDFIYLVSTEVVKAVTATGEVSYRALLTPEDKKVIDEELAYVEKNIGQGDFNYIAPYYHQFTFEAVTLPDYKFAEEYQKVSEEVCQAFDYYMAHRNQGRKFILAGFSQGGMLVLDVLKHMTDEQYSRLVAAYAIGYRLSEEDIKHKHIIPATDETSAGVTISFNSALSPEGIWPSIAAEAATSINPVNWKTDATPASFMFEGSTHTAHIDPATRLVIVDTERPDFYRQWNANPVFQSANVKADCLHHWDLLFYTDFLHDNMQKRAQGARAFQ